MTAQWPDFYDPDLYEEKIGPGLRVGDAYAALLAGAPLDVAEYGCGPGEILLRLAHDRHRVTGLDRAQAMVARARLRVQQAPPEIAGRITVLHADINAPALEPGFDAVLLTNELVLHVLEPDALLAAFSQAAGALRPGGRLILDLPHVDFAMLAGAYGALRDHEFCRGYFPRADGTTLRVNEHVTFDPQTWVKTMTFKYEQIGADGQAMPAYFRQLQQRVWTLQEIRFALRQSEFAGITSAVQPGFDDRYFVTAQKDDAP